MMLKVTCAIIQHHDKFLVTQRSSVMSQPGKWEFPGGKIENGESEEECIRRELREELNIRISITGRLEPFKHSYDTFDILLIPFLANYLDGDLTLKEHMNYAWLERDELLSLDWSPADIGIMEQFLAINND